jgi:two-component system, chemotaxis family, CheB/CheR fusion protein
MKIVLLFEDSRLSIQDPPSTSKKARSKIQHARLSQLEQELATTREHLQTLIEEEESTNEELRSANEEIQSSNEELEIAKEELQSTNEELITLNEELKTGNLQLTEVNNDLANLLRSVNTPIVMVGRSYEFVALLRLGKGR